MNSKYFCLFLILVSVVIFCKWYELIVLYSSAFDNEPEIEESYVNFQWCPARFDISPNVSDLDCAALFSGDKLAIDSAKNWTSPCSFNDSTMMNMTENCSDLKRDFRFYPYRRSSDDERIQKETEYPLAFVVLVAQNAEQVVRLFQTIYRPWNLYCLAYDNDTEHEFKRTMHNLDKCYKNIVMPNTFVNVSWGGFSILQTTMNCLKVLQDSKNYKWRYVQIMSWNDFPLKTNFETVEIMQILNGTQDAELSEGQTERFRQFYIEAALDESKKFMKKSLPPGNMVIYKGSMAVTLSRDFVRFLFENPIAKEFYNWSQTMRIAEEQFFSTLVHNLHTGVPGGFPGSCLPYYRFDNAEKRYISRYQIWYSDCGGQITMGSCIFGVGDLHKLIKRPELVCHKVYLNFQPATYYCLSQLHFNKTFRLLLNYSLDTQYYNNLPAVHYHNVADKSNFTC